MLDGGQLRRPDGFLRTAALRGRNHRAAGADVPLGRRLPRPRLAGEAAGPGTAPGPAEHPRRPVCPVHRGPVRRSPGLRRGRLRRPDVQPARVRPATARRTGGPSRRRWAPWTCRTSWPSSTARSAKFEELDDGCARHHGRLLRRLPHRLDHQPRPPLQGGHRGARLPGSRELHRLLRHRLVLRRGIHRPLGRADGGAKPDGPGGTGAHAVPGHPQRGGPPVPGGAGPAVFHRAQAAGRGGRVPGLPGGEPRTLPLRDAAPPQAALRRDPAVVGPLPADGGEPGAGPGRGTRGRRRRAACPIRRIRRPAGTPVPAGRG